MKIATLTLVMVPLLPEFHFSAAGGWSVDTPYAKAESGPGRDGDGGDDRSGPGRGRGGDDDRDDDDGDYSDHDDSDNDNDDDDDDDDDNRGSGGRGDDERRSDARLGPEFNITLRYSNGWREWIRDGRYVLVDPQGHTVANRPASRDDAYRMRKLVQQ